MYSQSKLQEMVRSELECMESLASEMEMRLERLTEGALIKKGKYLYRAYRDGGKQRQVIIPEGYEGGEALVEDLQDRRYISKALPVLRRNVKCCHRFLRDFQIYDPQEIRKELPPVYKEYDIRRISLPGDADPEVWAEEEYRQSTVDPDGRIYKSEGGVWTRSKAEAEIATKLEQRGLNFRYEEVITVGERSFSPDFSILCRRERQVKFWEHLGMMDDPEYAAGAIDKLCHYAAHGIRMGDNLIVTWETRRRPLLFEQINACIDAYLVD